MMRCLLFVVLISQLASAQLVDDFSDNDFKKNPTWIGDTSSWHIANSSLQSYNQTASSSFFLATTSGLVKNTEWQVKVNLQFNTSSANYVDIYLSADSSNLKTNVKNGYFVRIGGTKDEICLYKKLNGVSSLVIDGIDGTTNSSSNTIALKITCSDVFQWKLERNLSGLTTNYTVEGQVVDSTIKTSNWFGISVVQSTASFFQKHFFDNISVKQIIKDTIPPSFKTIGLVTTMNPLKISFDEEVDSVWLNTKGSIQILDLNGQILTIDSILKDNDKLNYNVLLKNKIQEGIYIIKISDAKDVVGNVSTKQSIFKIVYQIPAIATYKQIVISELMVDPVPAIGLPEKEYIEIYNPTNKSFDLNEYVLSDPSISVKLPTYILQSNEYLILCKSTDSVDFKPFGKVLGLSTIPSLNNSSDVITLKNANGDLIDQVAYSLSWYRNSQKDDGGYSLELIDPLNTCLNSENWKASESSIGGTPGIVNSVLAVLKDSIAPSIKFIQTLSSTKYKIGFSENIDSSLFLKSNFLVSKSIINSISWNSDSLDCVFLELESPISAGKEYLFTINKLKDCAGNINDNQSLSFVLPEKPKIGDVLINEVLFNPLPFGADFVELFNMSDRYLDLQGWTLANLKNDTLANKKVLFKNTFILKPYEYLVVTEDKNNMLNTYVKSVAERIFEVPILPTFYDDLGNVILIDADNVVIDRLDYDQTMHSVLLSKKEGVSLEKINPTLATNVPSNWTSASKESGYATPGYANSQYMSLGISDDDISIEPQLITPDGDGDKDFMVFRILTANIANLRNITIYDVMGREVKRLLKNGFAGSQTLVQWDGTDEANNLLPLGHYIVWFEAIDKSGNVVHLKKKVVVGARF